MKLILVDDARARRWSPFAETRPLGELRFGAMLLRERAERFWRTPCEAHLMAGKTPDGDLAGFDEPGAPRVTSPGGGAEEPFTGDTLFWLSRAAPALGKGHPPLPTDQSLLLAMDGRLVGLWFPGDPDAAHLTQGVAGVRLGEPLTPAAADAGVLQVQGTLLDWPWSLVEANARVLADDLAFLHPDTGSPGAPGSPMPDLPGVHLVGGDAVSLGQGAEIGPGVVLDTRDGPIRLDQGVVVEGPARLVGPLHLGAGSIVFGGHISRTSTGPVCKLRGEIDTVVFCGFDNKAHDGYLGHALVGRWVNLGALTTNSDLKNDYGPVRVQLPDPEAPGGLVTVDTGLMKVGALLGDHVKTGIGTVLNTGSAVGAGSNVFGGGMPPKTLPPFSWAGGGTVQSYRWEKFVEVARTVTARRDQPWTPGVEAVLRRLWERTHGGSG